MKSLRMIKFANNNLLIDLRLIMFFYFWMHKLHDRNNALTSMCDKTIKIT